MNHNFSLNIQNENNQNSFKKAFFNSIVIHLILFLLIFIPSVFLPKNPLILQSSVRVDLVGLPDFTKKEINGINHVEKGEEIKSKQEELLEKLKKAEKQIIREKTTKQILEELKKEEMALQKKKIPAKKSTKEAIEKIKALLKIEDSIQKKQQGLLNKGNVLSSGSGLIGTQGSISNEYADAMKAKLNSNWNLPVWLSRQKLSAQVVIFLDKQGNVTGTVFTKSSGNKQYDEYVLQTIHASEPFGPPPREIFANGVQLGFPL